MNCDKCGKQLLETLDQCVTCEKNESFVFEQLEEEINLKILSKSNLIFKRSKFAFFMLLLALIPALIGVFALILNANYYLNGAYSYRSLVENVALIVFFLIYLIGFITKKSMMLLIPGIMYSIIISGFGLIMLRHGKDYGAYLPGIICFVVAGIVLLFFYAAKDSQEKINIAEKELKEKKID